MDSSSATARTCDRAQLGLVQGELPEDLRAHVDGCSECGFLRTLSRNLQGAMAPVDAAGPLGGALHAALAAAIDGGELLLGRYRLKEVIGRGGYGEVYRTVDTETDELVALKIVRLRAGDDRSTEEVRNARRVVHPNVCRVFHTERYGPGSCTWTSSRATCSCVTAGSRWSPTSVCRCGWSVARRSRWPPAARRRTWRPSSTPAGRSTGAPMFMRSA
jgi:hypothetical protein